MPTKIFLNNGLPKNRMKYKGPKGKLFTSLTKLLDVFNTGTSVTGKGTGIKTRIARAKILKQALRYLFDVEKYKITDVKSLKQKHIDALLIHWLMKLSPSTIQGRCSVLRTLCKWTGSHRLVIDPSRYGFDPKVYKRQSATSVDKTWSGQDVNFFEKIAEVEDKDPVVAAQLRLMEAFGLRARESWLFKPGCIQKAYSVYIEHGTKGGLSRELNIIEIHQLEVLDAVKQYANDTTESMIPSEYSLIQWERHFYYICKCCGISRENKLVPHGLRHEMANKLYELFTGQLSPVKAKSLGVEIPNVEKECDSQARYKVAEYKGHSRKQTAGAYCGTIRSIKIDDNGEKE